MNMDRQSAMNQMLTTICKIAHDRAFIARSSNIPMMRVYYRLCRLFHTYRQEEYV